MSLGITLKCWGTIPFTLVSVADTGTFRFTNAATLIEQLMTLVGGNFLLKFPTQLRTKSSLHCYRRFNSCRRNICNLLTPFFTLALLAPLVARFGNPCSAISKLHHFTYLNTFWFNSCVFQLIAALHLTSFCILHYGRIKMQSLKLLKEHMNRCTIFLYIECKLTASLIITVIVQYFAAQAPACFDR